MKRKVTSILIAAVAAFSLSSCVTTEEDHAALQAEVTSLEREISQLRSEIRSLKSDADDMSDCLDDIVDLIDNSTFNKWSFLSCSGFGFGY